MTARRKSSHLLYIAKIKTLVVAGTVVFAMLLLFNSTDLKASFHHETPNSRDCQWLDELPSKTEKVYSAANQDDVLQHIFSNIGTKNKYFVEFGFGYVADGKITGDNYNKMELNTANLRYNGWNGIYFDALLEEPTFGVHKAALTSENIIHYFNKHQVPPEFDYLSIDVDSIDFWLFKAVITSQSYRPRVISVEYNSNFAADMYITMQNTWHEWTRRSVYGASAAALNELGQKNGYTLVYIMNYLDMFFIRSDLLSGCREVPSFRKLAHGVIPMRVHEKCKEEDLSRLVDLHALSAYPENITYANTVAREVVQRVEKEFGIDMCG